MGLKNLRVVSIVDQFLEHSRIYHFKNAQSQEGKGLFYIGSADLMKRNLDRRVEVLTPIENSNHKKDLSYILNLIFSDNTQSWMMLKEGLYRKLNATKKKPSTFNLNLNANIQN